MANGKRWTLVLMAAVITGGSSVGRAGDDSDVPAATLTSKDGTVQLGLPDGWVTAQFKNSVGKIQATSAELNGWADVVFDAKEDVDVPTLKAWAEYNRGASAKTSKLGDREQTDLEAVTINGHAGFRYTITGTFDKVRFAYVKTYVETDRHYAMVMCWTVKSHAEKAKADFDYLSGHVSDVGATAAPAPADGEKPAKATATTTAKSKDDRLVLAIPAGWEQKPITTGEGQILVKSDARDAQAEVYAYAKDDLDFKDLKAWAEHARAMAVRGLSDTDAKATDLKPVTVNGHAGFQFTLTVTYQHYRLIYVRTYLETDGYYVHVSCWTGPSHRAAAADDFEYIQGHATEAAK